MKHYMSYIQDVIRSNWDGDAVTDYQGTISYTYGQLAQKVAWLNLLFEQLGLRAGDKIAICGRNSSNWGVAYLAIAAYRGVAVSILPEFTSESIHELVTHSDARLLFIGPWVKGRIDLDKMPQVETFISLEDFHIVRSQKTIQVEDIDRLMQQRYPHRDGSSPADPESSRTPPPEPEQACDRDW